MAGPGCLTFLDGGPRLSYLSGRRAQVVLPFWTAGPGCLTFLDGRPQVVLPFWMAGPGCLTFLNGGPRLSYLSGWRAQAVLPFWTAGPGCLTFLDGRPHVEQSPLAEVVDAFLQPGDAPPFPQEPQPRVAALILQARQQGGHLIDDHVRPEAWQVTLHPRQSHLHRR